MSNAGEKDTSTSNKETDANMRQSGDEDHSTEQNASKRFSVKKLKFAPEIAVPSTQNSDGPAEPLGAQSPQSPTSPGQFIYVTNEAIPMTVFYRSQHSQGRSRKQRPTLQELRKGFENNRVSELLVTVPHKIDPRILPRVELCKILVASVKCRMFNSFI